MALSSPFEASDCAGLPFEPSLTGTASVASARENGAGLAFELNYPGEHEANLSAVSVTLPSQLVARLTTLQKACPEATFVANPAVVPRRRAQVGEASVQTPVLPAR